MGRPLIILGTAILIIGVLITLGEKLPLRLGRLPGDIEIRGKNSVFYFPLATCVLVSLVLSLVIWIFTRR